MLPTDLLYAALPLRISVQARRGPLIVPLWFHWDGERFWCVSQVDAAVVGALHDTPRCAFDLSTNDMPYRGIRGRGDVRVRPELGGVTLDRLIDRYRIDRGSLQCRDRTAVPAPHAARTVRHDGGGLNPVIRVAAIAKRYIARAIGHLMPLS